MSKKLPDLYGAGFLLVLIIFIFLKLPDLALPYFWDELGVYASGALRMHDTGIGILPASLEPLLSRGHPLLCYTAFATVFSWFGDTVLVGHAFALFIACATLLVFFLFVKDVFNQQTALISAILLCMQPMFYAMSAVILPEMMLTCFSILAVWGLIKQKWWLYITGAGLAVLTKESGLILPATALTIVFISALRHRDLFSRGRMLQFLWAFIPLLIFLVFIIIQKIQYGWFFFPFHTGLITKTFLKIINRILVISHMFLYEQGRWLTGLAAVAVFGRLTFRPFKDKAGSRALRISMVFIFFSVIFACLNYYLHRYLLPILPFIILGAVYFVHHLAARVNNKLISPVMIGVFGAYSLFQAWKYNDSGHFSDVNDMSYRHMVLCKRDCIRWAEQQPWNETVLASYFPVNIAFNDYRLGYLERKKSWPYTNETTPSSEYGIYYLHDEYLPTLKVKYQEIKRFTRKDATFIVIRFIKEKEKR